MVEQILAAGMGDRLALDEDADAELAFWAGFVHAVKATVIASLEARSEEI